MNELDDLISGALMTCYGYHQEIDWRTDKPVWVKGRTSHKPNPLNDDADLNESLGDDSAL